MEMPGRRSNYSLLSQYPNSSEDHQSKYTATYESFPPSDKNKAKSDRVFDWSDGDFRSNLAVGLQPGGRMGPSIFPNSGLQRQSSGSSFAESSLSGDYHPSVSLNTNDPAFFNPLQEEVWKNGSSDSRFKQVEVTSNSSNSKSFAQQTEESYQLQLALALRLSAEATHTEDPNFMDNRPGDIVLGSPRNCLEYLAYRYWVNGCLSYCDKVPDGFYQIWGLDSYVWAVCTDQQESGRMPSLESLMAVVPNDSSIEVVLIDKRSDFELRELENKVIGMSFSCITTKEVVEQLGKLVCSRMGAAASTEEGELMDQWKECTKVLKGSLGSVVLPVGSLSVGLCRHRTLLFKVLADTIDLPCRIAKGCKYCGLDDASSCIVRFGADREYLVDLIGNPGSLCEPDSFLNGPSSLSISSPLRPPRYKSIEVTENFKTLAKQYFMDSQSLDLIFDGLSTGRGSGQEDALPMKNFDSKYPDTMCMSHVFSSGDEVSQPALIQLHNRGINEAKPSDEWFNRRQLTGIHFNDSGNDSVPLQHIQPHGHRNVPQILALVDQTIDKGKDLRLNDPVRMIPSKSSRELPLAVDELDIPWSDLLLKERIGAGSFGTVHRADWHGSDVAVKILMEQDFQEERLKEFLREVAIMKRLRHPNIVLFMGAVTRPPNLSIVTEYLSRGSLYRLLRKPAARELLDDRRRLRMALDVAKGMNYLHRHNPPIVHRDLKSPNLLVDKTWTVKVCDFGLSRLKANTFLSSKSLAGTPSYFISLSGWLQKFFAMNHQMRNLMCIALG
ncbi:serine/threonine-protein kinase CTR1 isoform X2 [Amborella trichopoda]|uniref:serine/threonine-protein kinase CTR1 isoform X2 n=1 Tax=Amborella trichopoda TaxID=13333 RepID=UPI0005D44D7F|nr:serine/threonine-protein kinase CTR1 isoform X2 [Amborella trichopoda]|eukprot:XP_011625984.1 serine/threonine-protein kinase CTR1 isoform X2 [Amborella trichopoda]